MTTAIAKSYPGLVPGSSTAPRDDVPLDRPRRDLLELAASGAPIDVALNAVVRTVAQVRTQETRAAIFIFDPAAAELRFVASQGLDEGYTSQIDHFPVADGQPSCGKAAYTGEDVIVGDVAQDAAWMPLLGLAEQYGIAACWSFLLKGPGDRILGTFALYHRTPSLPDPAALEEVRYFVNIASLMIDRHIATETLQKEQRAREAALLAANREKDVFIATLAHELRNPLAAMSNCIDLLRFAGEQSATRERALGGAGRQLAQMTQLIEDLLDINRLERGQLALRKVEMALQPVLEQAVETVVSMVNHKRQQLSLQLPSEAIVLRADPVRVTQMVTNLLNNASRYSGVGGKIALDVTVVDGHAVVRVRDDGIGIAPEHLGAVFTMFSQIGASKDSTNKGLGIGLNLVDNLATMHGGSVAVHSDGVGKGAEFVLRLPLA